MKFPFRQKDYDIADELYYGDTAEFKRMRDRLKADLGFGLSASDLYVVENEDHTFDIYENSDAYGFGRGDVSIELLESDFTSWEDVVNYCKFIERGAIRYDGQGRISSSKDEAIVYNNDKFQTALKKLIEDKINIRSADSENQLVSLWKQGVKSADIIKKYHLDEKIPDKPVDYVAPPEFPQINTDRWRYSGRNSYNDRSGDSAFDEYGEKYESLEKDMKFKLVEADESKICCICKKPFDGYGNNAEPVCSGTCCDECNMEEVIPMRFKMINEDTANDLLNEGNAVSSKIPETIDQFLQDIAQMYGTIDYGDIMDHEYTAEDLQKLAKLRGKFRREINYADGGDEEAAAVCEDIANTVAEILKRVDEGINNYNEKDDNKMNESKNNTVVFIDASSSMLPYQDAARRLSNRYATDMVFYFADTIGTDPNNVGYQTGIGKVVNYIKEHPNYKYVIITDDDPETRNSALKNLPNIEIVDARTAEDDQARDFAIKNAEKNISDEQRARNRFKIAKILGDDKMNEDMSVRAKLKALYPELDFGDEVEEAINEAVDLNKTLGQFSNGDEYYDYFKKVIGKVVKENNIYSKIAISDKALRITSIEDDFVQYFRKDLIVNALNNIMHESDYSEYTPFDIFWEIIDEVPNEDMGMHHYSEKDEYNEFKHAMNIKYGFTKSDDHPVEKELNEATDDNHVAGQMSMFDDAEADLEITYNEYDLDGLGQLHTVEVSGDTLKDALLNMSDILALPIDADTDEDKSVEELLNKLAQTASGPYDIIKAIKNKNTDDMIFDITKTESLDCDCCVEGEFEADDDLEFNDSLDDSEEVKRFETLYRGADAKNYWTDAPKSELAYDDEYTGW